MLENPIQTSQQNVGVAKVEGASFKAKQALFPGNTFQIEAGRIISDQQVMRSCSHKG